MERQVSRTVLGISQGSPVPQPANIWSLITQSHWLHIHLAYYSGNRFMKFDTSYERVALC